MLLLVWLGLTKLFDYQHATCHCRRMEFVIGTISLSCELLFSLSCSCFRSCWAGTFVCGKWCFV